MKNIWHPLVRINDICNFRPELNTFGTIDEYYSAIPADGFIITNRGFTSIIASVMNN